MVGRRRNVRTAGGRRVSTAEAQSVEDFKATLVALDGTALAAGRDFTETGELKSESAGAPAGRGRGAGPGATARRTARSR